MRQIKTVTNVYTFQELSAESKGAAIELLYDINVDHGWWVFIYDDAAAVGLCITSFDHGRANCIEGYLDRCAGGVASAIVKDHGNDCETTTLAKEYLHKEMFLEAARNDYNDYDIDEKIYVLADDFKYALSEEYLSMLKKDYEYLTSVKAIEETILSNEYEFTVDGKLF